MMIQVLVVDDNEVARNTIRTNLSLDNPDWAIDTAPDESVALNRISQGLASNEPISLLITDLKMAEEQSGMNLLKEARRLDPTLMAIMFTGREDLLDRQAALETGAFDVIERNLKGGGFMPEMKLKARYAVDYWQWQRDVARLSPYFDSRVFQKLRRDPGVLEMRERLVTIVFWDIRGFTRLCDILKAQPALITEFLREYCERAARIIFDHDGVLDKFIGDGVMSLFGVLEENADDGEKDAVAAVRSALAFRAAFEGIVANHQQKWDRAVADTIEIGVGAGIHTCNALVGSFGTRFRDQFTALGDGVNIASRIEKFAKPGQVLLSLPSKNRVDRFIETVSAGTLKKPKNRSGRFKVFAAKHERPVPRTNS